MSTARTGQEMCGVLWTLVGDFTDAMREEDYELASKLIRLNQKRVSYAMKHLHKDEVDAKAAVAAVDRAYEEVDSVQGEILANLLEGRIAVARGDTAEGASAALDSIHTLKEAFEEEDYEIDAPQVAKGALAGIMRLAKLADRAVGKRAPNEDDLAQIRVTKYLSQMFGQAVKSEKMRVGALQMVNLILSVYLKMGKLMVSDAYVKQLATHKFRESMRHFTKAERVEKEYHCGRFYLLQSDSKRALKFFQAALSACHHAHTGNLRRILARLVPLKIGDGTLPSPLLLHRYDLHQYKGISESVKTGRLTTFEEAVRKHRRFFIESETMHELDLLRNHVFRTLLRKTSVLLSQGAAPGKHIRSADFQRCLDLSAGGAGQYDAKWVAAALIGRKMVKGYVATSQEYIVLANDAFPSLVDRSRQVELKDTFEPADVDADDLLEEHKHPVASAPEVKAKTQPTGGSQAARSGDVKGAVEKAGGEEGGGVEPMDVDD